nr:hypothetical protein [Gammaproteobacteria bacterium]
MGRHDAAAGAGNDSGGEKETRDPLPRAVQRVRGPRAREASRAARRGPGPGSARDRRPDHALGRVPRVQRARDRRARVVPARRLARITWRRWHFPCLGARVAAELRSEGRSMEGAKPDQVSVAESFLRALKRRGIDYVFANAGTDFAPIIEALVKLRHDAGSLPQFITVPHENLAVAMAHGYYLVTGKPAGVMVHVTVGTANTVCALMNAYRDEVPVLLMAGRTPITQRGHIASRTHPIHWGQENFDQAGIVREYTKWNFELRAGQPVDEVVGRALDVALAEPRGPVYLMLPREVLADADRGAGDATVPAAPVVAEPERGTSQAFLF